jgi:hypothetical protein
MFTPVFTNAQSIFIGLAGGLETQSEELLITDSLGLYARGEFNAKFINPVIRTDIPINSRWQLSVAAIYRKSTLSVSAWSPQADTCVFCPVLKGGGPTTSEIRLTPETSWTISRLQHKILLQVGLTWAIRMRIQHNSSTDDSHGKMMKEFSSIMESNPIYMSLGVTWLWKRLSGSLKYESTRFYTRQVSLVGNDYPFQISEHRLLLVLGFKVFQF